MDYGDAQAPKVFRRSDARKHPELGGSDCAAAENDLVALDGELLAAALYSAPTAWLPSKMIRWTVQLGRIVRLSRYLAGSR